MPPADFDKTVVVTRLSITAPRIEICSENGNTLATASAAFYQGSDGRYLITNWHNLAGINPLTGEPMHATGKLPFRIRVIGRRMSNDILNVPHEFEVDLRDPESGVYVWKQHPIFGKKVDVGALKLPDKYAMSYILQ